MIDKFRDSHHVCPVQCVPTELLGVLGSELFLRKHFELLFEQIFYVQVQRLGFRVDSQIYYQYCRLLFMAYGIAKPIVKKVCIDYGKSVQENIALFVGMCVRAAQLFRSAYICIQKTRIG